MKNTVLLLILITTVFTYFIFDITNRVEENTKTSKRLPLPMYGDIGYIKHPFYGECSGPIFSCQEVLKCFVCKMHAKCKTGFKSELSVVFDTDEKKECIFSDGIDATWKRRL